MCKFTLQILLDMHNTLFATVPCFSSPSSHLCLSSSLWSLSLSLSWLRLLNLYRCPVEAQEGLLAFYPGFWYWAFVLDDHYCPCLLSMTILITPSVPAYYCGCSIASSNASALEQLSTYFTTRTCYLLRKYARHIEVLSLSSSLPPCSLPPSLFLSWWNLLRWLPNPYYYY